MRANIHSRVTHRSDAIGAHIVSCRVSVVAHDRVSCAGWSCALHIHESNIGPRDTRPRIPTRDTRAEHTVPSTLGSGAVRRTLSLSATWRGGNIAQVKAQSGGDCRRHNRPNDHEFRNRQRHDDKK